MKRTLRCSTTWTRRFHATRIREFATLARVESGSPDIQAFQQRALAPKKPWLFRHDARSPTTQLHAPNKWFSKDAAAGRGMSAYMAGFQEWPFPYELVHLSPETKYAVAGFYDWLMWSSDVIDQIVAGILQAALTEDGERSFVKLYSPLRLLIKALEFNKTQKSQASGMLELCIVCARRLAPAAAGRSPYPGAGLAGWKGGRVRLFHLARHGADVHAAAQGPKPQPLLPAVRPQGRQAIAARLGRPAVL